MESPKITHMEYFGYRKNFASDIVMVLDRKLVEPLETELRSQAKVSQENHDTFKFADTGGNEMCVTFSDFKAYFGRTLRGCF